MLIRFQIALLNTAVWRFVDEETLHRVRTEACLSAVGISWKEVGSFISRNGGSYSFGCTTCKKKWMEIRGIKPTREKHDGDIVDDGGETYRLM
jgi:hypothetical protein